MTVLRNIGIGWDINVNDDDLFALERLVMRVQRGFLAMGVAGAAAFAGIFGTSLAFEDSLARVMAMVNLTGNSFDQLQGKLARVSKNMSEKFGVSFEEIHDDMRNIINLGIDPLEAKFLDLLEVVNKLKKVGEADPLKTARAIQKSSIAFKDMPLQKIANMIFVASKTGPNFIEEIADAMNKAIPLAVLMQQPLDQILGTLTAMSVLSVSGAQLGTRLFSGMALMMSGKGRAKEALEGIGLDVNDFVDPKTGGFKNLNVIFQTLSKTMGKYTKASRAQILMHIFGRRVGNAYVPILMREAEVLEGYIQKIAESGDHLEAGFLTRMETGTQKINQFQAAFRALVASIDKNKAFGAMADNLRIFVHNIRVFLDKHPAIKDFVATFISFGLAIVTLTGLFGFLQMGIMLVTVAMGRLGWTAATAFGKLILGPLIAAASLILLFLVIEDLIGGAHGAENAFQDLARALGVSEYWGNNLAAMMGVLLLVILAVVAPVTMIIVTIVLVAVAIYEAIEAVKAWGKVFPDTVQKIKDSLRGLTDFFSGINEKLDQYGGILWFFLFGPLAPMAAQLMHAPGVLKRVLEGLFPKDRMSPIGGMVGAFQQFGGETGQSREAFVSGVNPKTGQKTVVIERNGQTVILNVKDEQSAFDALQDFERKEAVSDYNSTFIDLLTSTTGDTLAPTTNGK